ncbi:hypothetical protein LCGC14_1383690 [marine sediment metagenome]|uniref:MT-A70 family protein n=1 Tax=marine sediment metagenome TaxID=412755 RepID=A0A0F9N3I0_9ZZZZ
MSIEKRISNLPAKAEDLAEFILIGKKALIAQKAKLEAIVALEKGFAAKEAALSDTQDLAEVLLYAEAKFGELIPPPKRDKESSSKVTSLHSLPEGVDKKQSHYAQQLNKNKEVIAQVVAKAREQGEVPVRQQVLREIQKAKPKPETPELPEGIYDVIYADPPWLYGQDQHGKEEQETVLSTYYQSMSLLDICGMNVKNIVADNAVLFLWTTSPKLYEAKEVIDAWGFEYKTSMIWDKIKHNVGYYVSVRHEFLLICTRGSFLPQNKELHDSVVSIERTKHSEKPEYFRQLIDRMYPQGKRIELFARKKAQGWDVYGDDPVLQG